MGILTDASLSQKFGRSIGKLNRKWCILLYVAAVVWFGCLGHINFNHATYLSENALSPGLVFSEVRTDTGKLAQTFLEELNWEREKHKSSMPYAWIMAKMRQIGLEVYSHNFTLNYPLGGGRVFHGRNVYGILRAPRIASTEGIVFSAPYRPPDSVHTEITQSVPILLAFADFARRKNYWAKDLIFLVTDQEQLGVHAWLQAYHRGDTCDDEVLNAGDLEARAGALQAAVNIEMQDFDLDYIDVKLEGLNGQLPNLDLFNLVQRLTFRESIPSGYKLSTKKPRSGSKRTIQQSLKNMVSMLATQANGVPTGNHGHFHRYRIEALTLEGVKAKGTNHKAQSNGVMYTLRTIEGISRSLNNLLERFHQSFFFYILVADDRFVSIGDFMPCLMLMAAALLIKAFLLWLNVDVYDDISEEDDKKDKNTEAVKTEPMQYFEVGFLFLLSLGIGLFATFLTQNKFLSTLLAQQGLSTGYYISIVLVFISCLALLTPLAFNFNSNGLELLHIATLVYTSTGLIVTGVLNFAFGIILSTFVVPLMVFVETDSSKLKWFKILYSIVLHPLVAVYVAVFSLTFWSFPEIAFLEVITRAFSATIDSLTFAVVDQIIYNNWAYNTVAQVFFPAWILLWNVVVKSKTEIAEKLKQS